MPTDLCVRNVPDHIVARLRAKARLHHHSFQRELLAILEEASNTGTLSLAEAEARLSTLGFQSGDDSTGWLRALRDAL